MNEAPSEIRAEEMLARGVAKYADGDLRGAVDLWRQALGAVPEDERTRAYVAWAESRLAVEERAAAGAASLAAEGSTAAGAMASAGPDGRARAASSALASVEVDDDLHGVELASDLELTDSGAGAIDSGVSAIELDGPTVAVVAPRDEASADSGSTMAALPLGDAVDPDAPTTQPWRRMDERELTSSSSSSSSSSSPSSPLLSSASSSGQRAEVAAVAAARSEEPVRRFLARAPTRPDLAPLDVPLLDESTLNALIEQQPPPSPSRGAELDGHIAAARRAVSSSDAEAAFLAAERAVEAGGGTLDAPGLHEHASLLLGIYERQLGHRDRTVRVGKAAVQDPQAAFLLSRVDGTFSIDDLVEISGMPTLAAVRLVAVLLRQGALAAR